MPDNEISLREIQEVHLTTLKAIRDEVVKLFDADTDRDPFVTQTLKNLFSFMSQRSQAVSFLVSSEYAWDAEIVLRSFYEAAAKIAFICLAKPSDKTALVEEFWDELGLAGDRRRSRKAKFSLDLFRGRDEGAARIFEHLSNMKSARSEPSDANRAARKAIERKWSFSEIIESVERDFTHAKSLLHMYGMASHLIHADQTALELMMDRRLREPQELLLLRMSHVCRIFGDQVHLSYWCAECLRRHFGGTFSDAQGLRNRLDRCADLVRPLSNLFDESQKDFYEQA